MKELRKLNASNLSLLPKEVAIPAYDRSKIKAGIVHIGIGGFFRAHEAFYTDQVLHHNVTDWGICGIALLDNDFKIVDTLVHQDGLYTLMAINPDGTFETRIIGSVIEYIFFSSTITSILHNSLK